MLMKGADYKEVIAAMDEKDGAHRANPFVNMTKPTPEHVVQEETQETQETEAEEENKDEE